MYSLKIKSLELFNYIADSVQNTVTGGTLIKSRYISGKPMLQTHENTISMFITKIKWFAKDFSSVSGELRFFSKLQWFHTINLDIVRVDCAWKPNARRCREYERHLLNNTRRFSKACMCYTAMRTVHLGSVDACDSTVGAVYHWLCHSYSLFFSPHATCAWGRVSINPYYALVRLWNMIN